MNPIKIIFEDESLWKKHYPQYKRRDSQIKLSEEIFQTIKNKSYLIAEAGTGTGKTIAYLLPMILFSLEEDKKILISTETKALQNQILTKDIPILEKILDIPIKAEICLGSNNYICKRRLKNYINSNEIKPNHLPYLENFLKWEKQTNDGIILNYPEDLPSDFISEIVRIPNLCLSQNCPNFNISYYFLEKEKWKKARILIVNHHLLSAHIESDFSILPKFDIAIVDEAHSFPQIYRDSNIKYFSFRELYHFIKKFKLESLELPIKKFEEDLKKILSSSERKEDKIRWEKSLELNSLFTFVNEIENTKKYLEGQLKLQKDLFTLDEYLDKSEKEIELQNVIETLNHIIDIINIFYEGPIYNRVHYIEFNPNDIKLCISYVEVGEFIYEKFLKKIESCIFTSATLSINNNFDYFIHKIGLTKYKDDPNILKTIILPSPFDYKKQSLLYIPKHLKEPTEEKEFLIQCSKEIFQLINLVNGNTLVIFTSKNNLNSIYKYLLNNYGEILKEKNIHIYSQENYGAQSALKKYLNDNKGVLFGLESYRQGIDIAGDKLKCVILVKLPFSVPSDPIQITQMEMEKDKNRNPFITIQIPEMIIKLKQGIGRLIRTETDKGIIAILDPRIYTKQYGNLVLKSLPESTIVNSFLDLEKYYQLYIQRESYATSESLR